jgi:hypothetical protein
MIMQTVLAQDGGLDFNGLAAALSALGGIVVALGTIMLNRQKQKVVDSQITEEDNELLSEINGAAIRHIRTLERGYAQFDQTPPPRPEQLRPGYRGRQQARRRRREDDGSDGSDGGDQPPEPGRHRHRSDGPADVDA